ncbi:MAG: hypothetical protein AB7F59_14025 [Bdellovibrionales bacterium]
MQKYLILFAIVFSFSINVFSSEQTIRYYFEAPLNEQELTQNMYTRLSFLRESVKRNWNTPVDVQQISVDRVQFLDCEEAVLGGATALRKNYLEGLQKGLACLSSIDQSRRADAKAYFALLTELKTPITFFCHKGEDVKFSSFTEMPVKNELGEITSWKFAYPGVTNKWFGGTFGIAMATKMGYTRWPSAVISIAAIEYQQARGNVVNISKTLFHEGMHWLGYFHKDFLSQDPDLTIDAADCCIEQDVKACQRLHSAPYDPSPYL